MSRDPTSDELREMLPGCLDCPVDTSDPDDHHSQMREVCIGCFLEGPHARAAGGARGELEAEKAKVWRLEELLESCRGLSEQRREELGHLEADNRALRFALRETTSDRAELYDLLRDAEAALLQHLGERARGMHTWLGRLEALRGRRR